MSLSIALPGWLGALVSAHGSGVVGGAIRIAPPGTPEHAALLARYEVERARRDGSADWLTLRSARGARSVLIGDGVGAVGLLLWDPSPRPGASALWLACGDGRSCEAGDDEAAFFVTLSRGAPAIARVEDLLTKALAADANALDVPRLYDTRDDDDGRALRDALVANDEAAADVAFERFAGARSLPRRLGEARAALSGVDTTAARDLARVIDRMAARNPAAAQLSERKANEPHHTIHELQAMGFAPGGTIDENLAAVVDGPSTVDAPRLAAAFARLGQLGDPGALVAERLRGITVNDAFSWLAVMRDTRMKSPARDGVGPLETWLPPAESCWPVFALALFEAQSFTHAGRQLVRLLSRSKDSATRPFLMAMLEHSPHAFINGAAELAADWCLSQTPATLTEANRWISSVRSRRPLPRRYTDYDADGAVAMALLARSVALPEVARFFVTDVTRSPSKALEAAKAAPPAAQRDILHALYSGAVPIDVRFDACQLAIERGDRRALVEMPLIEKSLGRHARRMTNM